MRRMQGREHWLIPILMTLFAAGGTTYGMAEETLAFYAILIPAVIAIGYDTVTGVAIILIGASVGVLGSTINPQRGRDPFHPRLWLCFALLLGSLTLSIGYVMRYAARVKAHPSHSVVAHLKASNEARFLAGREPGAPRRR